MKNAIGPTRRGLLKGMLALGAVVAVPAFELSRRAAKRVVEEVRDRAAELAEMTRWAQEAVDKKTDYIRLDRVLYTPPPDIMWTSEWVPGDTIDPEFLKTVEVAKRGYPDDEGWPG